MAHLVEAQRLRMLYLEDAARNVFPESKTTSGQLMRESVALRESVPNATWPAGICRACGAFLLPGWTAQTVATNSSESKQTRKQQQQSRCQHRIRQRIILLRCTTCRRGWRASEDVRTDLAKATNDKQMGFKSPTPRATVEVEQEPSAAAESNHKTSASSKQRAKARKDRLGLQGLASKLGRRKPSSSLNLMDLMAK
jgi:hypothetical protein